MSCIWVVSRGKKRDFRVEVRFHQLNRAVDEMKPTLLKVVIFVKNNEGAFRSTSSIAPKGGFAS